MTFCRQQIKLNLLLFIFKRYFKFFLSTSVQSAILTGLWHSDALLSKTRSLHPHRLEILLWSRFTLIFDKEYLVIPVCIVLVYLHFFFQPLSMFMVSFSQVSTLIETIVWLSIVWLQSPRMSAAYLISTIYKLSACFQVFVLVPIKAYSFFCFFLFRKTWNWSPRSVVTTRQGPCVRRSLAGSPTAWAWRPARTIAITTSCQTRRTTPAWHTHKARGRRNTRTRSSQWWVRDILSFYCILTNEANPASWFRQPTRAALLQSCDVHHVTYLTLHNHL